MPALRETGATVRSLPTAEIFPGTKSKALSPRVTIIQPI
jgi:hypothetical protein